MTLPPLHTKPHHLQPALPHSSAECQPGPIDPMRSPTDLARLKPSQPQLPPHVHDAHSHMASSHSVLHQRSPIVADPPTHHMPSPAPPHACSSSHTLSLSPSHAAHTLQPHVVLCLARYTAAHPWPPAAIASRHALVHLLHLIAHSVKPLPTARSVLCLQASLEPAPV